MGSFEFIGPSRVKILLVPINGCNRQDFDSYVDLIRNEGSEVRLLDLTPQPGLHAFNPQAYPQGNIRFEFVTSVLDSDTIFLHDFEPHRKVFVTIGIGKFHSTSSSNDDSVKSLTSLYPTSIVHNQILFDTPRGSCPSASDHSARSTFHYTPGSGHNNIQSIMCGISENFLNSLENYASSYTNITLRSPVSINNSSQMLPMTIAKAQKRLSSSSGFKLSNSSGSGVNGSGNATGNGSGGLGNGSSTIGNGTSSISTGGGIISDKSKLQQRQYGRQAKLMGNFCILAGKHTEALNHFNEACLLLKKCDDFLWLGSALEGIAICIVLLHQTGTQYQLPTVLLYTILQIPKGKFTEETISSHKRNGSISRLSIDSKNSSSLYSPRNSHTFVNFQSQTELDTGLGIPEIVKYISIKIFQLFSFSMNDFENMVPDYVFVDTLLRYITYMVSIYKGNSKSEKHAYFTKSEIISNLDKVFQTQLSNMNTQQQFKIYCTLSNIYQELSLERKRAFILRIILVDIIPKLKQQETNSTHLLTDEYFDNSFGFRDIIKTLFHIYNTDTPSWTSLQIPLLKVCLELSEMIKDWLNSITICLILLSKYLHSLDAGEQIWIKEKFDTLVDYSRINNLTIKTNYWDPFLVRELKFISKNKDELMTFTEYLSGQQSTTGNVNQPFIFDPYKKEKKAAFNKDNIVLVEDTYQLKVALQNPFAFEIEINDIDIVTSEGSAKVQTLKNLIRPAITPGQVAVTSSYGAISSTASPLMKRLTSFKPRGRSPVPPPSGSLPPATASGSATTLINSSSSYFANHLSIAGNSIREFVISFKSLSVGELKIIGFNATISNCTEQFFSIVESEKEAREVKAEAASSLSSDSMAISNPEHRERTSDISLTVIKQQPTLTLTNILVNNGWLMLLAGEKYKFSIQLTNQSTELINYLSFSFWDSTIDTLNHKLSNLGNNTPASDVYELEWYLLKYKPFRILNKEQIAEQYKKILPQSQLTIEYEITGKKGMKELKMILEYSNKEGNDGVGLFVKYVHVPIQMTITPLIEIIGCELLPLLDSSLKVLQVQEELDGSFSKLVAYLQKLSTLGSLTDYCMLVLDLKNSWTESLLVDLVQDDPEIAGYPINEIIESKKTTRVFIPIKKICSVTSDLQKPIPSLMNKQFIKNYLMSEEEDLEMKQLFWLRESILKKLKGTWATKNKERSGVIDLRSIRLSKKMARTITKPKILFEQVVVTDESGENVPRDGAKYVLEAEEFYTIVTKISNNSVDDFHGIVRYIPSPMETNNINTGIGGYKNQSISIDRKILFNGVLQHGIGVIPKGETVTIKLGITILERGTYEWGTILEELGNGEVIGSEPLILVA